MRTRTLRTVFVAVAMSVAAAIPAMANDNQTGAEAGADTSAPPVLAVKGDAKGVVFNMASTKALVSAAKEETDLVDDPAKRAAAEQAVAENMRRLIAQGANPGYDEGEAFCNAVLNGNLPAVKVLVEMGHVDPNIRRGVAMTIAALRARDDIINYLIDHGMDVNGINKNGRPLASAASNNHVSTIELLVRRGADININDGYPLAVAAKLGADSMAGIKGLLANGARINTGGGMPLYAAIDGGNEEVFKFLIAQGADINIDNGGPLRIAVGARNKDAIVFLLNNGADINAGKGAVLRTALDSGDSDITQFLIGKGADVTLSGVSEGLKYMEQNPEKYTDAAHQAVIALLSKAREGKNMEPITDVAKLPEADVVADYKAKMAGTAQAPAVQPSKAGIEKYEGQLQYDDTEGARLSVAVLENDIQAIKDILARKTADIDYNDGLPLQNAAMSGNMDCLKLLLDAGADINASEGIVIMMAADAGNLEMVKYLLERKADPFSNGIELFLEQMQVVKSAPAYAGTKYARPVYDEIAATMNAARKEIRPDYVPKTYTAVPIEGNPNMFKSTVPSP